YQLHPGDPITLRLPDPRTGALTPVTFHYAGVVAEFPTAPKDSFLVANAAYLTAHTTTTNATTYLIDTGATNTTTVATAIRRQLAPRRLSPTPPPAPGPTPSTPTPAAPAAPPRTDPPSALSPPPPPAGPLLALAQNTPPHVFPTPRALGAPR